MVCFVGKALLFLQIAQTVAIIAFQTGPVGQEMPTGPFSAGFFLIQKPDFGRTRTDK